MRSGLVPVYLGCEPQACGAVGHGHGPETAVQDPCPCFTGGSRNDRARTSDDAEDASLFPEESQACVGELFVGHLLNGFVYRILIVVGDCLCRDCRCAELESGDVIRDLFCGGILRFPVLEGWIADRMAHFPDNGGIVELHDSHGDGGCAGVSEPDDVIVLLKDVGAVLTAERCKVPQVESDSDRAFLPRFQQGSLGKSGKVLEALVQFPLRAGDVDLDDFLSGVFPCVGDFGSHAYFRSVQRHRLRIGDESGVGKAESEGEHDILSLGAEIPVADVDSFFIVRVIMVREVADLRIILPCGPCRGELSGRVLSAQKDVRKCRSGLHSEL